MTPRTALGQSELAGIRSVLVLVLAFLRAGLFPPIGVPLAVLGHGLNLLTVGTIQWPRASTPPHIGLCTLAHLRAIRLCASPTFDGPMRPWCGSRNSQHNQVVKSQQAAPH